MTRSAKLPIVLTLTLCTAACATPASERSWGGAAHWPHGTELKKAAGRALRSPNTWVPLAAATTLAVTGTDNSLSRSAAADRRVFGKNAGDWSDGLRDASKWTYVATALLAPSDSLKDKARGLVVGFGAVVATEGLTNGLKSLTGRERPNGADDESLPSGHASAASSWATLTARNIDYLPLTPGARTTLQVAARGVAAATGWARVEAEVHHVTDVLAGYALGNFVATFAHEAFLERRLPDAAITYRAVPGGGAVTLVMPLGARSR